MNDPRSKTLCLILSFLHSPAITLSMIPCNIFLLKFNYSNLKYSNLMISNFMYIFTTNYGNNLPCSNYIIFSQYEFVIYSSSTRCRKHDLFFCTAHLQIIRRNLLTVKIDIKSSNLLMESIFFPSHASTFF